MKNVNELKTYNLENHTIYTVNGRITLAKSKKNGQFINHVIAQMILNEHLKKQKLTYMILNSVTVLSLLNFLNKKVSFQLIDLIDLMILFLFFIVDLLIFCKYIY